MSRTYIRKWVGPRLPGSERTLEARGHPRSPYRPHPPEPRESRASLQERLEEIHPLFRPYVVPREGR